MGLFISRRKLMAAASSMHQFCPVVRGVFPDEAEDQVVETVTVFLYLNLAQEVFGRTFARSLGKRLCRYLKFTRPQDAVSRLGRIRRTVSRLRCEADSSATFKSPEMKFANHINAIVRSMLNEAGQDGRLHDPHDETFVRFEKAVRRMKEHLLGIKRQHIYLMT